MKLKHVFLFQVLASTINGGLFILAPEYNLSIYGVNDISAREILLAQLLGAALLSYALVAWYARDSRDSLARYAIVIGFGTTHLIGLILTLFATLNGTINAMGWFACFLYLVLAAGYGYFFIKPGD
ncbi:MAG: hypothetical protein ABFS03_03085 [Chloroflexota bacterium]